MAIRNFVFKISNQIQNLAAKRSLAYLNQIDSQSVPSRATINMKDQVTQMQREIDNMANVIRAQIPDEDRAEFEILKKYYVTGQHDSLVDPQDVLLQLDRIQVLKNLKMIELNEEAYDPELVRLEKLKARVLLEEEGALLEYAHFISKRPYNKPYEKWGVSEEHVKQQILG
ncbi:hypothetical protein TTHERM_00433830 (macronuclear) [Tetrahymena thermophila SB210]|uniref:Uncharacterized protein n=1 Tax=Tetrahymena thermophila (strain SB210) TaxID=312017 RepID=Q230X6_TETTS|nr:hypothetical protein TTHERM_00433830 [Tetrahymena thermophila SB210]7W5Z_S Chain S, Cytochrome c oxidase subunit TT19 [Tetrahymena thermophila]7W5Z_s Chain s, Cytochrome c oxidase subunit TT19 [Tetrahymena thermophila]8B6H_EK Chain EK, Complex III subunit VII [Tetrahymena thermophila SB210]8B6H_Ek Chain Ek, Complex III subunit VII [Tetrahymena thermophila SB210]8BQS_EK Chain EK, Complex III subunit VII [Tetrahymena thermophila SB210]8BQS_Ek Chain Ek, Complex III subunit VII [Tetrahymena th|eukprot:XP_001011408.2 hypothetical protein TTHERM_00433830 [Tetrahymena thermophila SB210]